MDGATSYVGEVGLYQNGSIVHEVPASEGIYAYPILESEPAYGVYMDGTDTGVVIGVSDKDKTIDFHTIQVSVADDAPWENAKVVLQKPNGELAAVLGTTKTEGNTVTACLNIYYVRNILITNISIYDFTKGKHVTMK